MGGRFLIRAGLLGLLVAGQGGAEDLERLGQHLRALATQGSRLAGYPGDRAAADLIEARLRQAGLEGVVREEFPVVVPVDRGATLELVEEGRQIPLAGLWPNLVRTTTTGPEGIEGELFYGGQGDFADLDGQELEGSLVLLEFNSWNNWLKAASLGARAVVFIAPEQTTLFEARQKWSWAPLDLPRFWVERPEGQALAARLGKGRARVRLRAQMDWAARPSWNIWGTVPGQDPRLRDKLWVIQTYYDGLSVVPSLAPAAESAAGIAALLELARYLKEHPPGRSVVLLATGAHFQGQAGLKHFLNQHARRRPEFKRNMPQRFVADSLKVERLLAETTRRRLSPESLGIHLQADPRTGQQTLVRVELDTLVAKLKRMRMLDRADSLGIRLEPDSLAAELFISLDLSTHSERLGVWHNTWNPAYRRFFVPLGRSLMEHGTQAARDLGRDPAGALVNGISPTKGRTWDSYISEEVFIPDGSLAQSAGQLAVSLMTVDDARLPLDTPLDLPERVSLTGLQRQSALLNRLLHAALGDSGVFGPERAKLREEHDKNLKDVLVDIRGGLRLLPRRTGTPDQPVPFGVVSLLPSFTFREQSWRPEIRQADEEGNYRLSGLLPRQVELQAFRLDPASGGVTYATDLGERGQGFGPVKRTLGAAETQWTTILFPAQSLEIYDRVLPRFLLTMGNRGEGLQVLDKRGAKPKQYGYLLGDRLSTVMVLFGAAGDSLRVVAPPVFLLNNQGATDDHGVQGQGYDLGSRHRLLGSSLEFARNFWQLDEVRNERLRRFGIENPRVQARHEWAGRLINRAARARQELRWEEYARCAREALGIEFQAYWDVRNTRDDVIAGVVFFVALLVPAAFFAERLLFAAPDIRKQLAFFGLILALIWALLSQVHPAFHLAHPLIVLLALMIAVMAFLVVALVVARFNTFMRELRQRRSGTMSAGISRSGTLYVAFMLGISNMRRRVLRTGLTLVTITLLTFTVLSFTSFKPHLSFVGFEKDWPARYAGFLLHDVEWWPWEHSVLDYVRSHFSPHGTVVPRTWISPGRQEGGGIPVQRGELQADAAALLGLSRDEPRATGIDQILVAGTWFDQEGEESVLLPSPMAEQLGIAPEEVGQARVTIFGKPRLVRGLFDPARLARLKDLNDEPLTPVRQKLGQLLMPGMLNLMRTVSFEMEVGFEHQPAGQVAILPYGVLASMDTPLYSVAVRFAEGIDGEALVQRFLSRTGFRVFLGRPGEEGRLQVLAYTSLGVTSMEGFGHLLIPMAIAALIVLNTMMGAVYERFREIGIYSSVGLAPLHIAFLFMAESCVYGVLGVTLGYLIGQASAKLLIYLDLLQGVSLNYSSTAAISSAVLVMLVVLGSTLYPARTASRLAVPDVVRRWQLPPPEGDLWRFPFPFTVNRKALDSLCGFLYAYFAAYGHESVGKLYTEKTRIVEGRGEGGEETRAVQLLVWLAPFDMGVSQYLQFTFRPTAVAEVYGIELYLERISGPVAFWQRLTLGFMLDLRQQFLIWQTLREHLHEEHARTARQVMVPEEQPGRRQEHARRVMAAVGRGENGTRG